MIFGINNNLTFSDGAILRPKIERVPGVQLQFCLARFVALDETNKAVRKTTHEFEVLSTNLAPRKRDFRDPVPPLMKIWYFFAAPNF